MPIRIKRLGKPAAVCCPPVEATADATANPAVDAPANPVSADAPASSDEVSFGKLLREIRIDLGISQREAAKQAKLSLSAVRTLESGDRSGDIKTIARLAKCFGYELDLVLSAPVQRATRHVGHKAGLPDPRST